VYLVPPSCYCASNISNIKNATVRALQLSLSKAYQLLSPPLSSNQLPAYVQLLMDMTNDNPKRLCRPRRHSSFHIQVYCYKQRKVTVHKALRNTALHYLESEQNRPKPLIVCETIPSQVYPYAVTSPKTQPPDHPHSSPHEKTHNLRRSSRDASGDGTCVNAPLESRGEICWTSTLDLALGDDINGGTVVPADRFRDTHFSFIGNLVDVGSTAETTGARNPTVKGVGVSSH
jgi:hypothetical protein